MGAIDLANMLGGRGGGQLRGVNVVSESVDMYKKFLDYYNVGFEKVALSNEERATIKRDAKLVKFSFEKIYYGWKNAPTIRGRHTDSMYIHTESGTPATDTSYYKTVSGESGPFHKVYYTSDQAQDNGEPDK